MWNEIRRLGTIGTRNYFHLCTSQTFHANAWVAPQILEFQLVSNSQSQQLIFNEWFWLGIWAVFPIKKKEIAAWFVYSREMGVHSHSMIMLQANAGKLWFWSCRENQIDEKIPVTFTLMATDQQSIITILEGVNFQLAFFCMKWKAKPSSTQKTY